VSDTIEYQLSYPDGRWTVKEQAAFSQISFYFATMCFFPFREAISVSIRHAMRPNPLVGISDIGIVLNANNHNFNINPTSRG
jgi:hypothetical protein